MTIYRPQAGQQEDFNVSHKTAWTDEQKLAAVAEVDGGASAKTVAERMGVTTSGLAYWRKTLKKGKRGSNGAVVMHSKAIASVDPHAARDAIIFLRKAKTELMAGIKNGTISDLDSSHLLSLLALRSLQGGS